MSVTYSLGQAPGDCLCVGRSAGWAVVVVQPRFGLPAKAHPHLQLKADSDTNWVGVLDGGIWLEQIDDLIWNSGLTSAKSSRFIMIHSNIIQYPTNPKCWPVVWHFSSQPFSWPFLFFQRSQVSYGGDCAKMSLRDRKPQIRKRGWRKRSDICSLWFMFTLFVWYLLQFILWCFVVLLCFVYLLLFFLPNFAHVQ